MKNCYFFAFIIFFAFTFSLFANDGFNDSKIDIYQEGAAGNNSSNVINSDKQMAGPLVASLPVTSSASNIGGILATDIGADKIPQNLRGIWEGKDRFVFIEQLDDSEAPEIVILLKDFYGWYYDRVAEPEKYSKEYERTRNSATPRNAEHITLDVNKIEKSELENTSELILNYSKYQKTAVPVVIIEENMFTDFYIQDKENPAYYRGVAVSQGITASEQRVPKEITSYYVDGEDIYKIRYWITDMDYSDRKVKLNYGDKSFEVDAHIVTGGHNYSCVSGRSKVIRNVFPPEKLDDSYIFTEDKTILIKNQTPYLTKLADKNDFSQLMEIVNKANSRQCPPALPLFPDSNVDFYWEIIDYLEKDVKLIQEVRRRQEAFGIRGKDIGK